MIKKPKKREIHPYIIELGIQIKKLRLKNGLSLEKVGSEIGIDASNLQKIELGNNITIQTILKICICLKATPFDLFKEIKWTLDENDLDKLTTPRVTTKKKVKRERK